MPTPLENTMANLLAYPNRSLIALFGENPPMKIFRKLLLAAGLLLLPFAGYAAVPNDIAPGSPSIFDGSAINAIQNYLRGKPGGAVTQITSRTTGVTINAQSGAITLVSASGSASAATFTVTNSFVGANDVVEINQATGTDLYEVFVTAVAAGSFKITSFTTGGTTTEQPVFNFVVVKGATS